MTTPYNSSIYDIHTRMSWSEKEESYAKHLKRQRYLEDKAEYEAEKRRDEIAAMKGLN